MQMQMDNVLGFFPLQKSFGDMITCKVDMIYHGLNLHRFSALEGFHRLLTTRAIRLEEKGEGFENGKN